MMVVFFVGVFANDALPADARVAALREAALVDYRIAADTDGVLSLWRSDTGGYDATGARTAPPRSAWTLVARGVDDLQVRYRSAAAFDPAQPDAGCTDSPDASAPGPGGRTRELRVRLGARTIGDRAVVLRAELATTVVPRPTIAALARTTALDYR